MQSKAFFGRRIYIYPNLLVGAVADGDDVPDDERNLAFALVVGEVALHGDLRAVLDIVVDATESRGEDDAVDGGIVVD